MIDASFVKQLAPEFAAVDDTVVNFFLARAKKFINFPWWGEKADEGHGYFTAHMMKIAGVADSAGGGGGGGGQNGQITSEKVGDLAVSYGQAVSASGSSVSDAILATTTYGQMFLFLRGTLATTPLTITQGVSVIL